MRDGNVVVPKFCYEKKIQVPTNVQSVHPQPCVVEPIEPVGEPLLDEAEVQQHSENYEGAHDVIVEVDESAYHQPCMVHGDKQFAKVDTMVLPMVQDKIVIPHIDFVIPNEFTKVRECKILLVSVLPEVIPELRQALRARVLILLHLKTRGQDFSAFI